MNEFFCDGLRADNPIGAMAAFGLFRLCVVLDLCCEAKLRWRSSQGSWRAVLHTAKQVTLEELAAALSGIAGEASQRRELTWAEEIKSAQVDVYVKEGTEVLARGDLEAAAWFAAFGTDLVTEGGTIQRTPFDMTGGPQRFLAEAVKLSNVLAGREAKRRDRWTPVASFREALLGPWLYQDDQHSLGWDPVAMRLAAFTHKEPSKMTNEGVRAVVWLAFQSLPLFPCYHAGRSLAARGWIRKDREMEFVWPVWTEPIGLAVLERLLGLEELSADDPMKTLRHRGIVAVYRSRRTKPNKYMTSFEPATACRGSSPAGSEHGS